MINTTCVARSTKLPKETWGKCQGQRCQYVDELGNGPG